MLVSGVYFAEPIRDRTGAESRRGRVSTERPRFSKRPLINAPQGSGSHLLLRALKTTLPRHCGGGVAIFHSWNGQTACSDVSSP